jgi:hypothetical protein
LSVISSPLNNFCALDNERFGFYESSLARKIKICPRFRFCFTQIFSFFFYLRNIYPSSILLLSNSSTLYVILSFSFFKEKKTLKQGSKLYGVVRNLNRKKCPFPIFFLPIHAWRLAMLIWSIFCDMIVKYMVY